MNKIKLLPLAAMVLTAGAAQANIVGYEETDFAVSAAYFFPGAGVDREHGPIEVYPTGNPSESTIYTDNTDSALALGIKADTLFSWGSTGLRYANGLKDGVNNDGELFLGALFIDTPFKALKLFGNYEWQDFDQGRTEIHIRYGFGFGAPILPGDQLITGYIAKRDTEIEYDDQTLHDGDNGYVLGLKADYEIVDRVTFRILGEFAWDRKFREVTVDTFKSSQLPQNLPDMAYLASTNVYSLSKDNLKAESFKVSMNLGYAITESIEIGAEFIYMRGEAMTLNHASMYGATVSYSF